MGHAAFPAERARVVVVGGGVGGLASAVDLARRGAEVIVLERAASAGGKVRQAVVGGASIDVGPTVLTMRWVMDELFADAGARFDAYVTLDRASRIARHAWSDGAVLDLYADASRSAEAIGAFAGQAEAKRYLAFVAYARKIYETVEQPFLRGQRPTALSMLRMAVPLGFSALTRIDAHRTMWRALTAAFEDPRLRQLFGRYATYAGSSPFAAPATLNVIAEVEREGVWLPRGGMIEIARALERLACAKGAVVCLSSDVAEVCIDRGRASGVVLRSGERIEADAVVVNADAAALAAGAFGARASRAVPLPRERSLSALTWAITGTAEGFALARHNVFFSDDYAAELTTLFEKQRLPGAPTVYVCAQDRDDGGHRRVANGGDEERFFCIVNAPATGDRADRGASPEEIEECERQTFSLLSRCGLKLRPRAMARTTPADFERLFPQTGGALYGAASHGPMSALARPSARSKIPGLYLAGGSAHPGAGVPMAILSGRLAANLVLEDLASTRRSRRADIAGSTSMP